MPSSANRYGSVSSSARSSVEHLAGDLLAPRALVVLGRDLEIAVQQIDHRQIGRRLAVRDRERFQHHPARLRRRLELEEQPRLADARPPPSPRRSARARLAPARRACLHRLHLALAPDELRQPAPGRALQPRAQRPEPGHLVNVDRLADAFDPGRAERLEREVALAQLARLLADRDRAGRRERLHPRREVGRMPDRRVLGLARAGRDRAHHHFAGVHADARLDRQLPPSATAFAE